MAEMNNSKREMTLIKPLQDQIETLLQDSTATAPLSARSEASTMASTILDELDYEDQLFNSLNFEIPQELTTSSSSSSSSSSSLPTSNDDTLTDVKPTLPAALAVAAAMTINSLNLSVNGHQQGNHLLPGPFGLPSSMVVPTATPTNLPDLPNLSWTPGNFNPTLAAQSTLTNLNPLIDQTQLLKKQRRRDSHNAVERRRRDNINDRIAELTTLVPEAFGEKVHKGEALRKAADYIRYLQNTQSRLHEQLSTATSQLESMNAEIELLRKQIAAAQK